MPNALPLLRRWRQRLSARGLRLWSGAVLGLFLLCHFANIACGLVSVDAMRAAAPVLTRPWHGPVGSLLLAGSLLVHFGLSLRALYRRHTLHMGAREAAQISLGLLLPVLLVPHVVGARIEPAIAGFASGYADQVRVLWVTSPLAGARQMLALLVAWGHGCFGFWFALRARPWFPRWTALLYPAALLVPVLAMLGFAEAGREIVAYSDVAAPLVAAPRGAVSADAVRMILSSSFTAALAGVLLARGLRHWRGRHRRIEIRYPDGRSVAVPRGFTVLEASRVGQMPHVALCGGRGRCSTCRIRVLGDHEGLPPPNAQERATLLRSEAAPDIRLACQLRPGRDLDVMPVFAPPRPRSAGLAAAPTSAASHERELAVLFCDLRGFTHRAERWLPFDTVFLLNQYFEIVGEAVEAAGGYLDKFIGDGALALFGLATDPETACRQALTAAAGIARGLETLNLRFAAELGGPLRVAMGVNTGPAIVGDMGYGRAVSLTAVGDGINVASRLEGEAKDRDVEAVVSAAVMGRAGFDAGTYAALLIPVRGRVAPVAAVLVPRAAELAAASAKAAAPA